MNHLQSFRLLLGCALLWTGHAAAQSPPANDEFLGAGIFEGLTAEVAADNTLATAEPGEPIHNGLVATRSLWWTYRSPGYANVTVTVTPDLAPTVVAVYTGGSLDSLEPVPGTLLYRSAPGTAFRFVSVPDAHYRIALESGAEAGGASRVSVAAEPFPAVLPKITRQPVSAVAGLGSVVTFSVTATGTPAVSFQWFREGLMLPGATKATLQISPVRGTNAGAYTVVVSNIVGVVRSEPAVLEVPLVPVITRQPTAQNVEPRGQAVFSVTATGGTLSYLWLKDGVPVPSGTSPTLTIGNVQEADVGSYSVQVLNFQGITASAETSLNLLRSPTAEERKLEILTAIGVTQVREGQSVDFEITTAGAKPMTFQWLRDGKPIAGATAPNLGFSAERTSGGTYSVTVTNPDATVTRHFEPLVVVEAGPPNDHFSNRIPIQMFVPATTFMANREPDEPVLIERAVRSAWWTYQMPADGSVTIGTQNAQFYPVLSVFTGTTLSEQRLIAHRFVNSGERYAEVTFPGQAGETFNLSVADYYGGHGSLGFVVSFTPDPPKDQIPAITQHPTVAGQVEAGTNVTLRVAATGAYPLSYQWWRGPELIPGAIGPTLALTNVQDGSAGIYSVVVTNPNGATRSEPVEMVVQASAPKLVAGLGTNSVTAGYPIILALRPSGSLPMSFEWELAGQSVPRADGPTLQWRPTRPTGPVSIRAAARNAAGATAPAAGVVSVVPAGVRYRWSTLAGKPGVAGQLDGQRGNARFNYPSGIAMDDQGVIYVADADSNRVRKITPDGAVSTFSEAWGKPLMFSSPVDIASGADGTILVLNQGSSIVRWFGESLVARFPGGDWGLGVAPDQTVWRAVNTYVERIALDGTVTRMASALQTVVDVTFDVVGNAYLAEAGGPTIRRLGLDGQLTVYAGTPGRFGQADGPASEATFQHPNSVSFDGMGNLYVADEFASTIRRISPDGVVTTLGGYNNRSGFADGIGFAARFVFPRRVLATREGILYVTDTGAHTIRKGVPVLDEVAPRLHAETAESGIALSWTVGDNLVWLERATAVDASSADWQTADPLSDSDTTIHLVRPEEQSFYRLRSP